MPSATRPQRPGALVGRRLADRLDLQLLDLVAVAVALDARQARVDHVADARHGQRGLGDVGRQHDAPRAVRLEDAVLLLLATGARTAAGSRHAAAGGACAGASAASRISRSPGRNTSMSPGRRRATARPRRRRWRRSGRTSRALLERPPAQLDREQPARHLDHRRRPVADAKCCAKRSASMRGRGDDHLQVGPARQDLPQVAEQEVDVQAALVRLVDDQRVVGAAAAGRPASRRAGCRRSSA